MEFPNQRQTINRNYFQIVVVLSMFFYINNLISMLKLYYLISINSKYNKLTFD